MAVANFYKYTTIGLLLLNAGIIAFFLLKPPPHPQQHGRQMEAISALNLDQQQHQQFKTLADQHVQNTKALQKQQADVLQDYFSTLTNPDSDLDKASLITRYQQLEQSKIESVYQHFQDIEEILIPTQLAGYETFIKLIVKDFLISEKKSPSPPKDLK